MFAKRFSGIGPDICDALKNVPLNILLTGVPWIPANKLPGIVDVIFEQLRNVR